MSIYRRSTAGSCPPLAALAVVGLLFAVGPASAMPFAVGMVDAPKAEGTVEQAKASLRWRCWWDRGRWVCGWRWG